MEHTALERQLAKQQDQLAQAVIALAQGVALKPILRHVGQLSMALTGARYAMLAYRLEGEIIYIPLGLTEHELALLGDREPQAIGLLGLMWKQHEVVRIHDIRTHPKAAGFPPHHPVMSSFLGAPIMFGDAVHGAIYLTEKEGGQSFTAIDETIVCTLASACATAISNAIHIERLQARNAELERLLAEREGHPEQGRGAPGDDASGQR